MTASRSVAASAASITVVRLSSAAAVATAVLASPALVVADQPPPCRTYEVVRLIEAPDCGFGWEEVDLAANVHGALAGRIRCGLTDFACRAHLEGEIELLDIPGQTASGLEDIRDDGLAVGWVSFGGTATDGLLSWLDGAIEFVDPPDGFHAVVFSALNDPGTIAGYVHPEIGNSVRLPVLYDLETKTYTVFEIGDADDGLFTDIGADGTAIGWMTSWSPGSGSDSDAIRVVDGAIEPIPELLPEANTGAIAMGGFGEILVTSFANGVRSSFVFDPALHATRLSTLGPGADTSVWSIDEAGWVVGGGTDPDGTPARIVWRPDGFAFPLRPEEVEGAAHLYAFSSPMTTLADGDILLETAVDPPDGLPYRATVHLRASIDETTLTADFDCDGSVGFADLLYLLDRSGTCGTRACYADLDGDGTVGFDDLMELIAAWR